MLIIGNLGVWEFLYQFKDCLQHSKEIYSAKLHIVTFGASSYGNLISQLERVFSLGYLTLSKYTYASSTMNVPLALKSELLKRRVKRKKERKKERKNRQSKRMKQNKARTRRKSIRRKKDKNTEKKESAKKK